MKKRELNPQEENFLREIVKENSSEEKIPLLRNSTREHLRAVLKEKYSGEKISGEKISFGEKFFSIFSYKVPAYQVGFALACALVFVWNMRNPQPEKIIVEREKVVYKIDTAQMQAEIARHVIDTVYKIVEKSNAKILAATKENFSRIAEKKNSFEKILPNEERKNEFVGLENLALVQEQKRGRNLAEDSALAKFTRTIR